MSSDQPVISVKNVSKCFYSYDKPHDRLKQAIVPRLQRWAGDPVTTYGKEYWALRDISFDVNKGETVGVVGRNGSGKSTLLQIICGTLTPTLGEVETHGRIAALLELGSGFNPEFTGRENVYLNGAVLGLSREEIDQRFDAIAGFADIGEFLDHPVKTYSSGMAVRLAFAVQAQVDPEILVVDEALSVGDARFQAKCFERLRQLKDNGTSILLVTHSSEQVVTHCSRAILLEKSRVEMIGKSRPVINRYTDILFGRDKEEIKPGLEQNAQSASTESADVPREAISLLFDQDAYSTRPNYNQHEYRWGDGAATLTDFHLSAAGNAYPNSVEPGDDITLTLAFTFNRPVINPIIGFTIKTKEGVTVYGTNSYLLDCEDARALGEAGARATARLQFKNRLATGDYFISIGLASREGEEIVPHDRRYDSIHFIVEPTPNLLGLIDLALTMEINR
ncbi:MAG: ABC transporter ATP-binding protein [Pseudomonas sp.]|uniref:ABC transporter related protein n=1 Tax=Pseudomonas putida (strain ATCC 700007 / DSM 6899 / JCM 31910 / BCRC 17059 / LMG 24140 / F1) TaxID=351746 RepID=A5W7D9_PSEP1|nr:MULTISPECIES: ABC transporter ATP-binding protein [Pseudomonas]MDD1998851.1 ABC transporter ATP-binding protein [Pseudomonas putida]MPT20883.1 ABC transporter ATP-binding protein [Pseudomonas sp.]POA86672.1 ABC transporter ATP-binding protein [Pseudomonas sp. FW305-E2]HDS1791518.1 ABC transporter ATP-binding protein [Pseudomonas putida]HEN8733559.1 ABC transporter ATP-binding protein [Pseudomonas putida]